MPPDDLLFIEIEFPTNEVYLVEVDDAAHLLAKERAQSKSYEEFVAEYRTSPERILDDLQEFVGWDDIRGYAIRAGEIDADYNNLFHDAELGIRE